MRDLPVLPVLPRGPVRAVPGRCWVGVLNGNVRPGDVVAVVGSGPIGRRRSLAGNNRDRTVGVTKDRGNCAEDFAVAAMPAEHDEIRPRRSGGQHAARV